jgi:CDP-diacylglycerol--glycerol-3-phosphate 3-phosphatidyltransferase
VETTAPAVSAPLAQLPNALTILRLALVPVFIVLMAEADGGHSWVAGVVFVVAAVTDQVDGWLARRWHVESAFGKIADPLADRLMIDAAVILLWLDDRLPFVALGLIVLRDVVLVGGYRVFAGKGIDLNVSMLGKVATWILYASLCLIIVTTDGTRWPLWLFWIGLALAVAAGIGYVRDTMRQARGQTA